VVLRAESVRQRLLKLEETVSELQRRLKGLGGFRNVLVHGYLRIDPARVEAALQRAPADFRDFARSVRRWLASIEPATT
jgi:uncharacterized protein YutE (UPF0331/DUF86 family)